MSKCKETNAAIDAITALHEKDLISTESAMMVFLADIAKSLAIIADAVREEGGLK